MKKTITLLCVCAGMLSMAVPAMCQTTVQNTVKNVASVTQQNGIKVMMQKTSGLTRINFLNTTNQSVAFTWSVNNDAGKVVYTSKVIVLKPGSTYIYPEPGEKMVATVNNSTTANSIKISPKN